MPGNRAEKADPFFEAAERQARLLGQLHKSPRVDLIGVVAPSGVGAGKLRGEKLWTITIGLEVWKPLGGTLRAKSLTIRTHGGNEELDSKRELIEPLTVVHLRALVAEESIFGSPQGLLVQFVGKFSSDAELNKIAEELKTPVTFVDSQFGIFTLDRCVNWFETETTWRGNPIVLTLNPEESSGVQSMLAVARTLWSSQSWRHHTNYVNRLV